MAEKGKYNLERAVEEADKFIAGAFEAKQFSATAKLLELKCKLYGLLVDRHELTVEKIDIRKVLEEAEGRVLSIRPSVLSIPVFPSE